MNAGCWGRIKDKVLSCLVVIVTKMDLDGCELASRELGVQQTILPFVEQVNTLLFES